MTEDKKQIVTVQDDDGTRLDVWLTEALQDDDVEISRSQVQTLLQNGFVTGPRDRVKASDKVVPGEVYTVVLPEPEPFEVAAEDIPVDIVYEDEHVVVVNKPRGLVVHPGAGNLTGTLVNGLVGKGIRLSRLGGAMRPGVVHRIDKDTSGLLVLAKTDLAYHRLSEQFREHSITRLYRAIVHGNLQHDTGIIDAPIGRDPQNRQRMAVREAGKSAVSHFRVLERFGKYTYLELRLETGRTHQIRVHMAYIGFPLAGDPVYGPRHTLPIKGQALHAATLGFAHPDTAESLFFTIEVPEDMRRLLGLLEAAGNFGT
ncbi:RluA family pseudouridine synthase [Alicyclobacillus mengziensis]|uniref:Pseudouridine synthase n=1 Tax=Alicyclobacillus mengziensis TaxID=2931921 RepID=A0A9X7W355_9BACL|nr:RluA family pseudouridine synthase [Alicyclobacillus mengziensis]QSO49485.1 RluA family pseudouridine synthase [Alicyclobacillus mengziensis]